MINLNLIPQSHARTDLETVINYYNNHGLTTEFESIFRDFFNDHEIRMPGVYHNILQNDSLNPMTIASMVIWAYNALADLHGAETIPLGDRTIEYANTGETYDKTLCAVTNKYACVFEYTSYGDLVEELSESEDWDD